MPLMRHSQACSDQEVVGRVEVVQPCEPADRRVVVAREPRQRVSRTDHVHGGQGAAPVAVILAYLDGDRARERHGVVALECGERVRSDNPVAAQVETPLHGTHAVQGRTVEIRVHRDADPLADEQELEHGDVPAERASPQRPRAEQRPAERPERLARPRIREPGDRQPVDPLELPHGGHGLRPRERVDRAAVEALGPQRHLQSCGLRVPARRERGRREGQDGSCNGSAEEDAQAHGVPDYATRAANPPGSRAVLPADEAGLALLGKGGETLLRVLAREQVAELLRFALERAGREVQQPLRDA